MRLMVAPVVVKKIIRHLHIERITLTDNFDINMYAVAARNNISQPSCPTWLHHILHVGLWMPMMRLMNMHAFRQAAPLPGPAKWSRSCRWPAHCPEGRHYGRPRKTVTVPSRENRSVGVNTRAAVCCDLQNSSSDKVQRPGLFVYGGDDMPNGGNSHEHNFCPDPWTVASVGGLGDRYRQFGRCAHQAQPSL